jgi:WD40 repeat protein
VGIDLGTSSLRLQVAHYDSLGRPAGEPAAVHLPHSERDGMLPTVLRLSAAGELLDYGRAAVQKLPHTPIPADGSRFVAEFKPCIGQAPEDLAAQGRPEKARLCSNPACPRPGWAWSVSLQFCGFCGAPLAEASERWQPQFPYPADEALAYSRLLLSEVRLHLERRLNEPLRAQTGWQIVAGVPVHWQAGTRASYHQVLAQAFPEAGITLLSEPEGALRYYGCQGLVRAGEGWTLVVDFGAGTTDLVLGRVFSQGGGSLLGEVRAYGERYGGADFDLLLARHAAAELGVELDPLLLSRWKLEAQRWKEAFSDAAQVDTVAETGFSFPVPMGERGCDFRPVVLDRPTFQRVAGELVERFRSVLDRGLRHFGAGAGEITQVVLTGGGAQWYFVAEAVRELCPGAHLVGGVEPVRAIARGLALAPALPQLLEASRRTPATEPERVPEPQPEPDPEPPVPDQSEFVLPEPEVPEKIEPVARPRKQSPAVHGPVRATLLQTLRATGGRFRSAALSPDGATVVTADESGTPVHGKGTLILWDTATGAQRHALPCGVPSNVAFHPDGARLIGLFHAGPAGMQSQLSLIELSTGEVRWTQQRNVSPMALGVSPSGDRIVTAHHSESGPNAIYWRTATGEAVCELPRLHVDCPSSLAFTPDGSTVAFPCDQAGGTGAKDIWIYRDDGRVVEAMLQVPDRGFAWKWAWLRPPAPAAFSPNGETLALGTRARTAAKITGRVLLYRWRPDAAEQLHPTMQLFDEIVRQGRVRTLDGHGDHVSRVAYSPDGRTLASGSEDGSVILWDPETGEARQTLKGHAKGIAALQFSRTGDRMMSASSDGVIQLWALAASGT